MLVLPSRPEQLSLAPPRIVAVGYRRINKLLQELAPSFADQVALEVLDVGFEVARERLREMHARHPIDVIVAAGSNGAYLRQHLETPVVLVKVGGFDLMQGLAQAKALARGQALCLAVVTYEGMAPDLRAFGELFDLSLLQRSYRTEEEAQAQVRELARQGAQVVLGSGVVVDVADQLGLQGLFLYSLDAVRGALEDAVEVARASRIEQAKRERLNTILAQLSDGVIAVDRQEQIQTLNPAMAHVLGIAPAQWLGRKLGEVCPALSLQDTLRVGVPDLERIERVQGKPLIVNRMPIVEQGVLTGAVITCQDPISIQRVDRHIRTRIKPNAVAAHYELDEFLGDSPAVARVKQAALNCARSQATVLLIGESGTGKELIAQGIHRASERRDLPFVAVNCAAVSESLLESELFGYEEGAFTGARRGGKVGLFEAAHKGTIFLDEVGEMPVSLQARLLRVLQEREVLRVGATTPVPVDVRVIAATHADLHAHVDKNLFRRDLYYRLAVLRLHTPALRERSASDVAQLAKALLQRRLNASAVDAPAAVHTLLATVLQRAGRYAWPGNVRELENWVERALACQSYVCGAQSAVGGEGAVAAVDAARLWEVFPECAAPLALAATASQVPLKETRRRAEQKRVREVLESVNGDQRQACEILGISRATLWRRMQG